MAARLAKNTQAQLVLQCLSSCFGLARHGILRSDFDLLSVKIAKALNLLAGDGKTNVYDVNSLAPFHWSGCSDSAKTSVADYYSRVRSQSGEAWFKTKIFHSLITELLRAYPRFSLAVYRRPSSCLSNSETISEVNKFFTASL